MDLTIEDFEKKYTYDDSVSSVVFEKEQVGMFETYGKDLKHVVDIANRDGQRVWTMVDEDGGMMLVAGYHLVNRIYYIITNEPWEDQNEYYLFDSYKEDSDDK